MPSLAGFSGRPGIVITLPQIATINPAPLTNLISLMVSVWSEMAPISFASPEKEYGVFAIHTGRCAYSSSINLSFFMIQKTL